MELCSFLTLDSFIKDPLTHDFMRKALLMSSLVAAVCGFLSSYLTLKGWALMGDAVSH
jgi:manganese transport system permease protein